LYKLRKQQPTEVVKIAYNIFISSGVWDLKLLGYTPDKTNLENLSRRL